MIELCGTCIYHHYDKEYQDWECTCEESDFYGTWTGYENACEEWEKRE